MIEKSPAKVRLYEAFAVSGKALSNAARLELLDLLSQGERTVEALAKVAGLNLTTASAHLQTLKQAGFVATRRDGVRIYYRLAGEDVAALFALLRKVAEAHQAEVPAARDAYLLAGGGESGAITREELAARASQGTTVVLDVRPPEEYRAGHIPGALSIPVDELNERINELPVDVGIVVYCRGEYCVLAYDAVRLLTAKGRRAIRLNDGMLEWRLADLPVTVTGTFLGASFGPWPGVSPSRLSPGAARRLERACVWPVMSDQPVMLGSGSQGRTSPRAATQAVPTREAAGNAGCGARKGQSESARTASSGRPTAAQPKSAPRQPNAARNPPTSVGGGVKEAM